MGDICDYLLLSIQGFQRYDDVVFVWKKIFDMIKKNPGHAFLHRVISNENEQQSFHR